jgi:uncharacterized protein
MGTRRVVIPGGSGQVGQMLAGYFHSQGDAVTVLARQAAERPWRTATWDGRDLDASWVREIDAADIVINLAGRSVNCRYNEANRREIMDSRVQTTRLIGKAIAECAHPPALWMNASTATIYRHALDRVMDEATGEIGGHEPGIPFTWKFSIDVATSWEEAFFAAETPRTRKIALRSAMVMWPSRGGIFATLLSLARAGLGGSAGSGDQFVSWIHGYDFMRALEFLIAHPELEGVVNISVPNPLPNREFMSELRRAAGVRIGLPATKWMLEIGAVFLRTETELILKSRRVVPGRLLQSGFDFHFPKWAEAAGDLVEKMD